MPIEPASLADPIYYHLEKGTYALADAMASTHEIQEIFLQKKDMEFEDWVIKLRHLLAQIDQGIYLHCGIDVFKNGLHAMANLPETIINPEEQLDDMPKQVLEAAKAFGISFDQVVKTFCQDNQTLGREQDLESLPPENKQAKIIQLCKECTELILNEFGLKGSDIARIY
jgi:hypothetical protein